MRNDVPPRLSIDKDAVYPLKAFQQLTGLGDAAMRRARRQGLAVFKRGSAWPSLPAIARLPR